MSMAQKKYIGEEVHRLRRDRDMTMEELARLAGVTYNTIYKVESLRKKQDFEPELKTLNGIARALGKTVKVEFV